jgi:hypothetical protein
MDSPVSTARFLVDASDNEVSRTFMRLRASKQLFLTVHELNKLLTVAEHRDLARSALKRLGLDQAG